MRVFHDYWFALDKKMPFKQVLPEAEMFLQENGYSYEGMGFLIQNTSTYVLDRFEARHPEMGKYYTTARIQDITNYFITSLNTETETLQMPKEDEPYLRRMLEKIPNGVNFSWVVGVLDNVQWFSKINKTPIFTDGRLPTGSAPDTYNANALLFHMKDGFFAKNHRIQLKIEVTKDMDSLLDDSEILRRAEAHFGKPSQQYTKCIFDIGTQEDLYRTAQGIRPVLNRFQSDLNKEMQYEPNMINRQKGMQFDLAQSPTRVSGLSGTKALAKAVKPFGMQMLPAVPGYSQAQFIDESNHKYSIDIDLSPTEKRLQGKVYIGGYNFGQQYIMGGLGSTEIAFEYYYPDSQKDVEWYVAKMVELLMEKKPEISKLLVDKFGRTPAWYWDTLKP